MQEQAASALSDLAEGDPILQNAIIDEGGIDPLLSLVRSGTQIAQEYAARAIWYLSTQIDNQNFVVEGGAVMDLVQLLKNGSPKAQYMQQRGWLSLPMVPSRPTGRPGKLNPSPESSPDRPVPTLPQWCWRGESSLLMEEKPAEGEPTAGVRCRRRRVWAVQSAAGDE